MESGKLACLAIGVAGEYPAMYGMRNPYNSHNKMDSEFDFNGETIKLISIGKQDMMLAKKLVKAGSEHRKFLRQIQVWLEMTFPRYFWQEFDTYRFNTKNSESTMHTLHRRDFELTDFYLGEHPTANMLNYFNRHVVGELNLLRELYVYSEKNYDYVRSMKRVLPESYLQMRVVNTNYEELLNIYFQRKGHRLKEEWGFLLSIIEKLPNFKEMIIDTLDK